MPPSRNNSNHKESLEVRRARGEISCAECRRHKLKCNKAIPCATCVRKGCPEICPNGTLTPGQQKSHSSSNESGAQTHKLMEMSRRIQQLEDALQIAHSSLMETTHPLLSDELLKIKNFIERPVKVTKNIDASDEETLVNSFGTLATLGSGTESYVGADKVIIDSLGSADVLHLKMSPPEAFSVPREPFPFKSAQLSTDGVRAQIEQKLPSFQRASALVEAYLENTAWLVRLVHREQIMEELIPQIYRRRPHANHSPREEHTSRDPHTLALLLAIFACGAVADLTLPPWNEEARLYYDLACTAIGLRSVFDGTSLHAVQALAVLASYDIFACRRNSLEGTWKLISFCMSLAASIGLHRDPTHFKFPPKQVQLRRQFFWELHCMDTWKSFGSGRPMTLSQSVVDCELPDDVDAGVNENGEKIPSVWGLRYRFAKEVTSEVADELASARALKYSEILLMDQKIRDFGPDEIVKLSTKTKIGPDVPARDVLENLMLILLKEPALLLLHRNFFVRALVENPTDPMQSQFAPSFLATYRCATTMLRGLRGLLDEAGHFVVRIWPIWAHALSASVLLGSVAACGTTSAFAPEAFVEFDRSIDMLERVKMHPVVNDLLPTVLQLRDRAYQALIRHGNNIPNPVSRQPLLQPTTVEGKDFNPLNSMGWMVRKIQAGHLGAPPRRRGLLEYLEESMPKPETPATSTPLSSGMPEDSPVVGNDLASNSGDNVFDHDQTLFVGSSSVDRSLSPASSGMTVVGRNPSHIGVMQHISGAPQALSPDKLSLYLPSEMQVDYLHSPDRISSFGANGPVNNYDFGLLQSQTVLPSQSFPDRTGVQSGHHRSPSATFGAYPSALNGGFSGTQMDPTEPPLNFDSLSNFSPEPFLNTDFDVSFNMRSSAGDESVVPLISDDLAPCRAILQDARFFGVGPSISALSSGPRNGNS